MCLPTRRRQTGLTLIELIIFIVIICVGLAGITVTYDVVVRGSADPMVRKQALVIAESLLLEIEQQAFTWCDPQDANVTTARVAIPTVLIVDGCASPANDQNIGGAAFPLPPVPVPTPVTEVRGNAGDPYDNVADYAGYQAIGSDIVGGNPNATYVASVVITRVGGLAPFTPIADFPLDAVLRIAVTVVGGRETVMLVGYRTRYAPNAAG
jgi:MSHA pilin protein MshD